MSKNTKSDIVGKIKLYITGGEPIYYHRPQWIVHYWLWATKFIWFYPKIWPLFNYEEERRLLTI